MNTSTVILAELHKIPYFLIDERQRSLTLARDAHTMQFLCFQVENEKKNCRDGVHPTSDLEQLFEI